MLHATSPSERLLAAQPTFSRLVIDSAFAGDVKGIGDMDGDGFVDLVIGGYQMYIYRYPTWTRQLVATAAVQFTTDMQLGDIDGDGDLDIITAEASGDNNVLWLENPRPVSSSSWARHSIGAHGTWAHDVEIADLDRDGKLDVITRGQQTYLFFQNTPSSWMRRDISNVVGGGEGMGIGDVNGDGYHDLAAAGAWIASPTNPRTGAWVARSIAGGFPWDTTAAIRDMNNDGRADVLYAGQHSRGKVAWYEAPADPTNGAWIEHVVDTNMASHKLQLGDINKDGRLDIVAGLELAELSVYLSSGDAAFTFTKQVLSTTGLHNQRLGDIGNDGDLDIFGANYLNNPPVQLWENTTPSAALPLNRWTYKNVSSAHEQTFGLAFADMNGDGLKDIVSGSSWYANPGGGMMNTWTQAFLPAGMHAILVTNVDGDGLADVIAQKDEGSLALYWLEATSAAATSWTSVRIGAVPAASHSLGAQGYRIGQVELGGLPEVLISSGNGIYYFRTPASPSAGSWPMVQIHSNPSDEGFAVGDIDRDGRLDVVATTGNNKGVEWYRNPGTGAAGWQVFPIGSVVEMVFPDRTEVADFDGDGRLDIVVSEENGETSNARTYWWRQPATATASNWSRQLIATQGTTNSMDVADMDGDGDIDVILAEHRGSLSVSIWANSGTGIFTRNVVSTGRESHLGARTVDLDGDSDLDIVSIAYDAPQTLHLWRNDALGGGSPPSDTTPPAVSLTAPAAGSTVSGMVTVSATASDAGGIAGVQFKVDGVSLGTEDLTAPYTVSWNTAAATPGSHTLTAVARDAAGNQATSAAVAVTVTSAPPPGPGDVTSNLVGYWAFDDGAGTIARDSAGSHPGTLNGPLWTPGRLGGGLAFDGVDDVLSLGSLDVAGDALTIAAWINADDLDDTDARILSKAMGDAEQDHYFMLSMASSAGTKLRFRLKTGNTSTLIASSATLTGGQWIHVAAVYDGTAMILYQDAVEVGRLAKTGALATNPSALVTIGRNPQLYGPFDGTIDDVRIYQRALTPTDIRALTELSSTPADTTPPVVSVTAPADGSTVSGTVTASATASDVGGVSGVQFKVDGVNLGAEDVTAPYGVSWNTATATAGSHTLTAVARDAAGNQQTSASISVIVAAPSDTTPPAVSLTAPANGSSVNGTVTVSAIASDAGGVASVQFKVDGVNLAAEDFTAPYAVAWNTSTATAGSHILSAVARDLAGNQATSAAVTVTVTGAAPGADITSNLVGYWTLDDGAGTTARDSAGSHPGTLMNGPLWTTGKLGQAVSFDGVDDGISLGAFDVAGTAMTIAAWINVDDFDATEGRILSKATSSAEEDHYFMLSTVSSGGMKLRFRLKTGTTTSTLIASSGTLTAGQWVHVAAVYTGSGMILYQNGIEVGRMAKTGPLATSAAAEVVIGENFQAYEPFDGTIDDVRIYQRALTPDDIRALIEM